jgi:glycogen debranching enzyme
MTTENHQRAVASASDIAVLAGDRFMLSDNLGDLLPGAPHGLYAADTRFLSSYILQVNGQRLVPLSAHSTGRGSARFYAANSLQTELEEGALTLVRERRINDSLHDELLLTNHALAPLTLNLSVSFAADFLDVFEVRQLDGHHLEQQCEQDWRGSCLVFTCRQNDLISHTTIDFSEPPRHDGPTAHFALRLDSQESWKLGIDIAPSAEARKLQPAVTEARSRTRQEPPPQAHALENGSFWQIPRLQADDTTLQLAYEQAVRDLHSLEMVSDAGQPLLAAGLPWFVALFGRDVLLTAYETLLLGPELARGALQALAAYQATEVDDFRDAEPGKMPHEVRLGRLARLGRVPHTRYYGSIDATELWLILLHETYRWTGDLAFVREQLPAAEAALAWIDHYADQDGDGFVEYARRSAAGLANQGWKDSWDAIRFADGRLADGPIALVEVQGYAYDARRRVADLFEALGQADRATALRAQAESLKAAFNSAFWLPEEGYYAVALDGAKRPVDSITSNPGHALWSGIIDEQRAPRVAERLLSPELFNGWGLRTLSTKMKAYSPVSYHNGSVWPHDTAIVAAGLARYGFREHAVRLLRALLEASAGFEHYRLPELFAGFERRVNDVPAIYPAANAPQAWAAGSIIFALRTLLGLAPGDDKLVQTPLPGAPRCRMSGVAYRGRRVTLRAARAAR